MISRIYFARVAYQWTELTFGYALKNIAGILNCEYIPVDHKEDRNFTPIPSSNDKVVVFFYMDGARHPHLYHSFKDRCPNATLVQIGGDIIYCVDQFHKNYGIDIHIDPNDSVIEELREKKCRAEKVHLTLSKTFGEYCRETANPRRTHDFICLAAHNTPYRALLFNKIGRTFNLLTQLPDLTVEEVVRHYEKVKCTIGTTSPCHDDGSGPPKLRSLKGFRDWIAPLCGNVLIYDDHPQLLKDWESIVPFYGYGDFESLCNLYRHLCFDEIVYNRYVNKQLKWIENNYLETQLLNVLKDVWQ